MKYDEYPDEELLYLIGENNEDAKDILYEKYKYIIEVVYSKYRKAGHALGIDYSDLYQEALLGFSDAIAKYRDDKSTKMSTFITLCVDRRLQVALNKAGRLKNKILNGTISIDGEYGPDGSSLGEIIKDDVHNDPLDDIVEKELNVLIKDSLSKAEQEVYKLMIRGYSYSEIAQLLDKPTKSIDNTIQRIKAKIRLLIDD